MLCCTLALVPFGLGMEGEDSGEGEDASSRVHQDI